MDVSFLIRAILRHFIVFLLAVFGFLGAAYAMNSLAQPIYQGTVSLVANISSSDDSSTYNKFLASQMLTKTYENTIQSRNIAADAKEKLGSQESVTELLDKVTVRTDPGTLVIFIHAKDENPESAVAIANAFANSFIQKSKNIVETSDVIVLDYADLEASSNPVSPRKMLNLALALFVGTIVGASLCVALEKRKQKRKQQPAKVKMVEEVI